MIDKYVDKSGARKTNRHTVMQKVLGRLVLKENRF